MKLSRITAGLACLFMLLSHEIRALPLTGVRTLDGPDGERALAMVPAPDGGRLILAHRASLVVTLRREDAAGNALWIRHVDDGGDSGFVAALSAARDGGAWLVVPREPAAPTIARVAPDGSLLWVKGEPSVPRRFVEAFVHELSDGSAIVAMGHGGPPELVWVARVSASGDLLWQRELSGLPGQRLAESSALLSGDRVLFVGGASDTRLERLRGWAAVIDRDGALVADLVEDRLSGRGPIWGKPLALADGGALLFRWAELHRLTPDLRLEPVVRVGIGDTPSDPDDVLDVSTAFALPSGNLLVAGRRRIDVLAGAPGTIAHDTAFVELDPGFAVVEALTAGGSEYDSYEGPVETSGFVRADGAVEICAGNGGEPAGRFAIYALGGPHVPGTECAPRAVPAAWTAPLDATFEPAGTVVGDGARALEAMVVPWSDGDMSSVTECAAARPAGARYDLDVKPGSCPSSLNLRRRGVIPAALVAGSAGAAAAVDPATVQLEGVPALRCTLADVSAPWDEAAAGACCGTPAPDGERDVVCHFDAPRVAEALCARQAVPPGAFATAELVLTATTRDGEAVRVTDCARLTAFGCASRAVPLAPRLGGGLAPRLGGASPR